MMSEVLLISYFCLWAIVLMLVLCVLVLARQVGLLHRRLRPSGALMANPGPAIGDKAPGFEGLDLKHRPVRIGGEQEKPTLVVFVSATCSSCEELAPALRSLWKSDRNALSIVMVGLMGSAEENSRFVSRLRLEKIPFVTSRDLGLTYHVGPTPYGVLIDGAGVVRAKGVVNHLEHLESLINTLSLADEGLPRSFPKQAARSTVVETLYVYDPAVQGGSREPGA